MDTQQIIRAIDEQIATLQQARALFNNDVPAVSKEAGGKRRGRPPGSGNKAAKAEKPARKTASKRTLSSEARAKIAAAQKARWAAAKKPAAVAA